MNFTGRMLPQCLDVERTILGSCLVDRQCRETVIRELDGSEFYSTDHRSVFLGMCKYPVMNGKNIDLLQLAEIVNQPDIEMALADISGTFSTVENIRDYYIPKLKDFSARRTAIKLKYKEIEQAFDLEIPFIEGGGKRWNITELSPRRFLDCTPKKFTFIINGLLAAGIVGFIYGEGGSFKSLALLWLVIIRSCIRINNNLRWLGHFEIMPGKSIFISAEDVETDLHHRTQAILKVICTERSEIPLNAYQNAIAENCLIVSREQWIEDGELFLIDGDGNRTAKYHKVAELINKFSADFVVFETLSRIANVDENNNRDAARVVGVLEKLRDDTGATILCNAHTSKVNRGGKTDTHGQNGMRGAGAFLDNSRFGLWFRALPKADGKDCIEVINSKTFRTQRSESFRVQVDFPAFSLIEKEEKPVVFDAVIEAIKEKPGIKVSEIRKSVTGSNAAINQALKDGREDGVLTKRKEGGYDYNS